MPMHFIVRFEPRPGNEAALRSELLRVLEPSRAEPGCLGMQLFESLGEPRVFAIHSLWRDEAAFEAHAALPHTIRFVEAAERLTGQPVLGLRAREIGVTDASASIG